MKARALKHYLNDTKYIVCQNKTNICIGSPYISELIKINKKTLKLSCAEIYSENGEPNFIIPELNEIYYKLKKLVDLGQIQEYLNGDDEIENKLPVYKEEDGEIIKTYTDAYGYPNLTIDGYLMYDNLYFKDKKLCKEYAINSYLRSISYDNEYIQQRLKDIENLTNQINDYQNYLVKLLKD